MVTGEHALCANALCVTLAESVLNQLHASWMAQVDQQAGDMDTDYAKYFMSQIKDAQQLMRASRTAHDEL
jgi:hypothetical protein